MKSIFKSLLAVIFLFLLAVSCREEIINYSGFDGFVQGTTYRIVYGSASDFDVEEMQTLVQNRLRDFDMSLSLYEDSSVLSKINRNESLKTDKYFTEAFKISKELWAMTEGAFDITVGPLVKAWGFGPDAIQNYRESSRDSLLAIVGFGKVSIRDGSVLKSDPRISLDFNAVAQGYSVDVICSLLDSMDIRHYLVEIGGEVRVKGMRDNRQWRIGIDRPVDNNLFPGEDIQAIINLQDKALATSGNYRKFYVKDGVKYSHTIDPRSGYPVSNQLLSATIIADECAVADGIATACMVMGKDESIAFLQRYTEFEAYLIFSDENGNFRTWTSESLKKSISESE
ncbi:MAG: FAD:protein FMN transferase [Bacteroidetes bacterium]|jgi:thiamine biosynthesis lipoprotein|nr:FAD:protein FMN transferase [Bacteroidota bacterium]